jgi:hypothetical protein
VWGKGIENNTQFTTSTIRQFNEVNEPKAMRNKPNQYVGPTTNLTKLHRGYEFLNANL